MSGYVRRAGMSWVNIPACEDEAMKKLILLVAFTLPLMAQAQPPEGQDWWACQSVASSGLAYEGGQWKPANFSHNERFILIGEGAGVTKASAAKALGTPEGAVNCQLNPYGEFFCFTSLTGLSFGFSTKTENGAIGRILGGVADGEERDTMHVLSFMCTKG